MKVNPELIQQQIFFDWVRWHEKIDERLQAVYHIPNGLHIESPQMRVWMKRAGLRSGVWDVNCAIPTSEHPGLWIEFKVKPNNLTPEQVSWGAMMRRLGYQMLTAWSGEEGINHLTEYLKNDRQAKHSRDVGPY